MTILNSFDSIAEGCTVKSTHTWKDNVTVVTIGWGLGSIMFIWWVVGVVEGLL